MQILALKLMTSAPRAAAAPIARSAGVREILQAKSTATVGASNNPREHEAAQVMRVPDADMQPEQESSNAVLRRKCAACEGDNAILQRKATDEAGTFEAPPIVGEVLRSPGEPLDPATRSFFEPRFGRDLSDVRVHRDANAAESAASVGAMAYTVGRSIVFGHGRADLASGSGRRLVAHELAHALQQSRGRAATVQRECVDGSWKYEYDGCSGPKFIKRMNWNNPSGGKDTAFAKVVSSSEGGRACDRHDECYQTPDLLGKKKCDDQMARDMGEICIEKSESKPERERCLRWAHRYHQVLQKLGHLPFLERQMQLHRCKRQQKKTK